MRTLTMALVCGVALAAVGCRTVGQPVRVEMKDCWNSTVFVDIKDAQQSGDMPKTVTPQGTLAASQEGDVTTGQNPAVDASKATTTTTTETKK